MSETWKVRELTNVTDDQIETLLEAEVVDGWEIERIDYVKEVGVRRPQMAYFYFRRPQRLPTETDA